MDQTTNRLNRENNPQIIGKWKEITVVQKVFHLDILLFIYLLFIMATFAILLWGG